jgi:hypothetical protein
MAFVLITFLCNGLSINASIIKNILDNVNYEVGDNILEENMSFNMLKGWIL